MARGFGSRARLLTPSQPGSLSNDSRRSSAGPPRRGRPGRAGGRTVGSSHDLHHDRRAAVPARRTGFHAAIPWRRTGAGPGQPLTHQVIEFTRRQLSNGKRAGGLMGCVVTHPADPLLTKEDPSGARAPVPRRTRSPIRRRRRSAPRHRSERPRSQRCSTASGDGLTVAGGRGRQPKTGNLP